MIERRDEEKDDDACTRVLVLPAADWLRECHRVRSIKASASKQATDSCSNC